MNDYEMFAENVWQKSSGLGKLEINGHAIEKFDREILDCREGALEEHIALQASGTVWFGYASAAHEHKLRMKKVEYDNWRKITMADVKEELRRISGTKGPTIQDVENAFAKLYGEQIYKREKEISSLEADVDMLKSLSLAWKEKGYAIKYFLDIRHDEKCSPTFDSK